MNYIKRLKIIMLIILVITSHTVWNRLPARTSWADGQTWREEAGELHCVAAGRLRPPWRRRGEVRWRRGRSEVVPAAAAAAAGD